MTGIGPGLALAMRQIRLHRAVCRVGEPVAHENHVSVEVDLDLDFGFRWLADGASPTGVAPIETVRFDFPQDFPDRACTPSLRPDFSRAFPHVMPWLTPDGRPVPCVVDGRIDEFLAARGMGAFVGQVVLWLQRAAEGALIDPVQGWTPIRRDDCDAWAVADADALRGLAEGGSGYAFLDTRYYYGLDRSALEFTCQVLGPGKIRSAEVTRNGAHLGEGTAVVLWVVPKGGKPQLPVAAYAPEWVSNWQDLEKAAASYGISRLKFVLDMLRNRSWPNETRRVPVPVFLLTRRPHRIEGQDSDVEIIPYLIWLQLRQGKIDPAPCAVEPLAQRDVVTPKLLQRLSGLDPVAGPWALLGAGSLGSKIGLHLARSGRAPALAIDRSPLSPHNAARHALYPDGAQLGLGWLDYKADGFAEVVQRLGGETKPITASIIDALPEIDADRWGRQRFLLNTTASLLVREAIARRPASAARGLEAVLYGRGRLGLLTCEGPERNPNAGEIIHSFYHWGRSDLVLSEALFGRDGHLHRVFVGEGCGSVTMVVDDASLSLQAAAMTRAITAWTASQGQHGWFRLWREDAGDLTSERITVAPFVRVEPEGEPDWQVSLSAEVVSKIADEIGRYRKVETGGVLIGRVSAVSRTIYVVDVLSAPPDSIRCAAEFILGVEGLPEALQDLARETAGALYCVGTWHSHLGSAEPSGYDRATAQRLAPTTDVPIALLIRGHDRFSALLVAPAGEERTE